MNSVQLYSMWIGIAVIVFFAIIFGDEIGFWGCTFTVAVVTGGLIATLADKKTKDEQKQ
jgi:hypothetical protein